MITAGLECLLKSRSELSVKISVDKWVQRGVEVPDPEDDGYNHRGAVTHFVSAEGRDDVPVTERRR